MVSRHFPFFGFFSLRQERECGKGERTIAGELAENWKQHSFHFTLHFPRRRKRTRRKRERALAKIRQILVAVFESLFTSFAAYSFRATKENVANGAAPSRRNLRDTRKSIRFTSPFIFGLFFPRRKRELDKWERAIAGKLAKYQMGHSFRPTLHFRLILLAPKKEGEAQMKTGPCENTPRTSSSLRLALLFVCGIFCSRRKNRMRTTHRNAPMKGNMRNT